MCEVATPVGVVFGGMGGVDELRKAKGLEPIFLPNLADIILPDSDADKHMKQVYYIQAALTRNNSELAVYQDEKGIAEALERANVIDRDDAIA